MVHRKALAQTIRMELDELEQIVSVIDRHWQRVAGDKEDQDAFLNSVALNLHSFYNGLERIMELIVVEMDGGKLGGRAWHSELLKQASLELPGVRPAVLRVQTRRQLDEYRKFRHRVRNIYATHLQASRMTHLITTLPSTWQSVSADLLAFADFLEQLENTA